MKHKKADIIFWIVFISLGFLTGVNLLKRDAQKGFGSLAYGTVPYFELSDADNEPVTLHMLKGNVWLVNFTSPEELRFYPQVIDVMRALYEKYGDRSNFRLVTVATASDGLLAADRNRDYERWHFLSGTPESVAELMHKGFHIDMRKDRYSPGLKLYLIDQNASVRGYYTVSRYDDIDRIEENLIRLL